MHIHATAEAVFARLRASGQGDWFGEAFSRPSENGGLTFDLAMPFRRERAQLAVTRDDAPSLLVMAADGDHGDICSLSWALHAEAAGEVHLTVEAAYRPAGGLLALLEPLLYAPRRRQAFRDALWRLKLLVEGGEAAGDE